MTQFKRDKKKYLCLAVDYLTYFFQNKVPWGPLEGAGLRLSIRSFQATKNFIITFQGLKTDCERVKAENTDNSQTGQRRGSDLSITS